MEDKKIKILKELINENIEDENFFIDLYKENSKEEEVEDYSEDIELEENKITLNFEESDVNIVSLLGSPEFIELKEYEETPSNINLILFKLLLMLGKELNKEEDFSLKNDEVIDILLEIQEKIEKLDEEIEEIKNKNNIIKEEIKKIENIKLSYVMSELDITKKKIAKKEIQYIYLYNNLEKYIKEFKKKG